MTGRAPTPDRTRVRVPDAQGLPPPAPGRPAPVEPGTARPPRRRWPEVVRSVGPAPVTAAVALIAVVQLWLIGFWGEDPRSMTDIGLMSLFGWAAVVSLLVLIGSFFFALSRRASDVVLGAHVLTYILLIHGTPAVLFGTLRYAWAWKHLGIVDFILRHGQVDTAIAYFGVYHNWPGFFGASAVLSELAGPENLIEISIWAPVVFNIANLLVLRHLFRTLGADRVLQWLAIAFFFTTTWVGQDYFSPQALCYLLYLALVATVLRHFRRGPAAGPVRGRTVGALALVTLLIVAIAASHQITPMVVFLVLTVLWVARRIRGWCLPAIALVAMVGWAATVAREYTSDNLTSLFSEITDPVGNVQGTFEKSATITGGQHIVSLAGRAVIVVVVLTAVVGVIRLHLRRQLDPTVLLLAGTPALLLLLTAFGGELLFRIFLFASPFLSYFAAQALMRDGPAGERAKRVATWPAVALSVLLIPCFLFAYYGKDQQNYFTPAEVDAGRWIAENSVPGTLLVRVNTNYPHDFHNYENVRAVEISGEAEPDRQRILADPVGVLSRWLGDPGHVRSYLVVTRSQKIYNDSLGPMPPGAVQRIEDALAASPQFTQAYRNEDAVVFVRRQP